MRERPGAAGPCSEGEELSTASTPSLAPHQRPAGMSDRLRKPPAGKLDNNARLAAVLRMLPVTRATGASYGGWIYLQARHLPQAESSERSIKAHMAWRFPWQAAVYLKPV